VVSQDKFETRLKEIKPHLMNIEEVSCVGIGESEGSPCLIIMLKKDDEHARAKIKRLMGDVPYKIQVTGEFRPLKVADT
jgi:hypothetical protein